MRFGHEQHALLHHLAEHVRGVGIAVPTELGVLAFEISARLAQDGMPFDGLDPCLGSGRFRERSNLRHKGQGFEIFRREEDSVTACGAARSEEHTSELQSLMRTSYAAFCLKNK